ncbi:MAG: cation diffusion facilitator family transporter [Burkholderiaceae bacterium]
MTEHTHETRSPHDHGHEDRDHQGHGHDHAHGHGHAHGVPVDATAATLRLFAIGIAINLGFVFIEAGFGWWADSLALLADAGHNFGDVIGLALAWGAAVLGSRKASGRFTYGLGGTTILAALANAMLLLIAVGGIVYAAVQRLMVPAPIDDTIVIWVAAVGVSVNAATAMLFLSRRGDDLNVRGAYLHMVADAAVSFGVVVAGLVIRYTGVVWIDPLMGLVIAVVILVGTWGLMRDSMRLALAAVPEHIDVEAVRGYLEGLPGVDGVHDLHIWAMSTSENALTAHLVMPAGHPGDAFLCDVADTIEARFRIGHVTTQIETDDGPSPCKLETAHAA